MNIVDFLDYIVDPTMGVCSRLLRIPMSESAEVMLMTIAGVESYWRERFQIGGPARGFWQFELGGGMAEVSRMPQFDLLCDFHSVPRDRAWEALPWNDLFSCGLARLLLWRDPAPLPLFTDCRGMYDYYLRCWRPGLPSRERWDERYAAVMAII